MQKLVSIGILLFSIYLLAMPVQGFVENKWKDMTIPRAETHTPSLQEKKGSDYSASLLKSGQKKDTAATPSSLYARAYCLMDADSGRVLFSGHADEKMAMASTTKIMTCILALENGKKKDWVRVSSYAASMPDVQLNICEGEKYRLGDLLYSLMLESHNDTAVAIAEHIGGSVEGFADMMNQKAEELGCIDTHFVTPNGLDDEEHYTTARELCLIAAYAIQNQEFLDIIAQDSYSFSEKNGKRSCTVRNHDAFLTQYDGAIGIKTGFTGNAGYCFCGAAKRDDRTLITSVLACGWPPNKSYKWSDTKKLMDYGFANYEKVTIPAETTELSCGVLEGQDVALTLNREDCGELNLLLQKDDVVTTWLEVPDTITAPVRNGDIIGYEKCAVNGEVVRQVSITAAEDIPEADFTYWFRKVLHFICF